MEIRISEDYCFSDVYVLDLQNCSLGHVRQVTIPLVKKYELCVLGGYNFRIKAIHILNAPPYADILISIIKLVFKSKIAERIHVHDNDLTSFRAKVPKESLPTEYGGQSGSISDNWDRWVKKIDSYHDTFLEREKYKSDESRRHDCSFGNSDLLGFEGSFRKLELD